jgi:hypothetical protein
VIVQEEMINYGEESVGRDIKVIPAQKELKRNRHDMRRHRDDHLVQDMSKEIK